MALISCIQNILPSDIFIILYCPIPLRILFQDRASQLKDNALESSVKSLGIRRLLLYAAIRSNVVSAYIAEHRIENKKQNTNLFFIITSIGIFLELSSV